MSQAPADYDRTPEEVLREIEDATREAPADEPDRLGPEAEFEVDFASATGQRLVGRFRYRVPSFGELRKIGLLGAALRGPVSQAALDAETWALIQAQAYLTVTIRDAPDWWTVDNVYDLVLVQRLYRRAQEHEAAFRGQGRDLLEGKKARPEQ